MRASPRRWPLVLALLLILLATLTPLGGSPPGPFPRIEPADVLINLLLYLPLGLLLAARGGSAPGVAVLALLLSGTIELAQALVIAGRRGSLLDILTNTAGALLGFGLFHLLGRIVRSRNLAAFWLASVLAGVPVALWLASGTLLAPAAPSASQWWSQWAHVFPYTERFPGTLLSVEFLGRGVPDGPLDSTDRFRSELVRQRELLLEASLFSGGPTSGPTQLAGIADGEGRAIVRLDQLGDDLSLTWNSRGAALGLRPPRLLFRGVLDQPAGERVTVRASVTASRASVTVRGEGRSRSVTRRLSVLTGWRSLIPSRGLAAPLEGAFDVAWTLVLLGYLILAVAGWRFLRLSY